MEINLQTYPVQILTRDYIVVGNFTPRGRANIYINDERNETFVVDSPEVTALVPGGTISTLADVDAINVPKAAIQVLVLGEFTKEDAQLLPRAETLVTFTDTFIVRGEFHMSMEAGISDIFANRGPFYGCVNAEILAARPLAEDVGGQAPIVYLNGSYVQYFYHDES